MDSIFVVMPLHLLEPSDHLPGRYRKPFCPQQHPLVIEFVEFVPPNSAARENDVSARRRHTGKSVRCHCIQNARHARSGLRYAELRRRNQISLPFIRHWWNSSWWFVPMCLVRLRDRISLVSKQRPAVLYRRKLENRQLPADAGGGLRPTSFSKAGKMRRPDACVPSARSRRPDLQTPSHGPKAACQQTAASVSSRSRCDQSVSKP